jgi:hypothetical protein
MLEIKAMFTKFNEWEDSLTKNIAGRDNSGMIQLYGGPLKDNLNDKLSSDKDSLRLYLYNISMESVKDISNGIQNLKASLNVKPTDLETFVQFVKDLNQGVDKKATLDNGRKLAQEQKDCLNRYKSKDPTKPSKVNN